MTAIAGVIGDILLPKNLAARMTISISLNFVWGNMNNMSFLTLMSLISVAVPGTASKI